MRRLAADYEAVRALCRESSILDVSCSGDPPTTYLLKFAGRGLMLDPQKGIQEQFEHSVRVRLGSSYPRQIPELHWLTPIYHPNISANGLVCLGGYTTNWVPSLKLDDLCLMLWDMIRYRNFDTGSPYNRVAAEWASGQRDYILPLDNRPLRDRTTGSTRPEPTRVSQDSDLGVELVGADSVVSPPVAHPAVPAPGTRSPGANNRDDILFID